jgi:hypothetical protein
MGAKDPRPTCQGTRPGNCDDGTSAQTPMPSAGPTKGDVPKPPQSKGGVPSAPPRDPNVILVMNRVYKDILDIPPGLNEDSRTSLVALIVRDQVTQRIAESRPAKEILNLDINLSSLLVTIALREEPSIPDRDDIVYAYVDHYYQAATEVNLRGSDFSETMEKKAVGYDALKIGAMVFSGASDPNQVKSVLQVTNTDGSYAGKVSSPMGNSVAWARRGIQAGREGYEDDLQNNKAAFAKRQEEIFDALGILGRMKDFLINTASKAVSLKKPGNQQSVNQ